MVIPSSKGLTKALEHWSYLIRTKLWQTGCAKALDGPKLLWVLLFLLFICILLPCIFLGLSGVWIWDRCVPGQDARMFLLRKEPMQYSRWNSLSRFCTASTAFNGLTPLWQTTVFDWMCNRSTTLCASQTAWIQHASETIAFIYSTASAILNMSLVVFVFFFSSISINILWHVWRRGRTKSVMHGRQGWQHPNAWLWFLFSGDVSNSLETAMHTAMWVASNLRNIRCNSPAVSVAIWVQPTKAIGQHPTPMHPSSKAPWTR